MSRSGMFVRKPKRQKVAREIRLAGTYWNGEPTLCTKVRVKMGAVPEDKAEWWCAGMEGQIRDAVKIEYRGETFYIDNQGGFTTETVDDGPILGSVVHGTREAQPGDGWLKVTLGMGSFEYGHAMIVVCEEVTDAVAV